MHRVLLMIARTTASLAALAFAVGASGDGDDVRLRVKRDGVEVSIDRAGRIEFASHRSGVRSVVASAKAPFHATRVWLTPDSEIVLVRSPTAGHDVPPSHTAWVAAWLSSKLDVVQAWSMRQLIGKDPPETIQSSAGVEWLKGGWVAAGGRFLFLWLHDDSVIRLARDVAPSPVSGQDALLAAVEAGDQDLRDAMRYALVVRSRVCDSLALRLRDDPYSSRTLRILASGLLAQSGDAVARDWLLEEAEPTGEQARRSEDRRFALEMVRYVEPGRAIPVLLRVLAEPIEAGVFNWGEAVSSLTALGAPYVDVKRTLEGAESPPQAILGVLEALVARPPKAFPEAAVPHIASPHTEVAARAWDLVAPYSGAALEDRLLARLASGEPRAMDLAAYFQKVRHPKAAGVLRSLRARLRSESRTSAVVDKALEHQETP